jgi:hypothetical protein
MNINQNKTTTMSMTKPRNEYYMFVQRIFKYLQDNKDYVLWFCDHGNDIFYLHKFVDSDWARDVDHRESTNSYVFTLFGGAMS